MLSAMTFCWASYYVCVCVCVCVCVEGGGKCGNSIQEEGRGRKGDRGEGERVRGALYLS